MALMRKTLLRLLDAKNIAFDSASKPLRVRNPVPEFKMPVWLAWTGRLRKR